jgi:lysozyme family protein
MKRNVEEIDESEARSFYQLEYITQFEWITDDDLCDLVIDCAILHSKARSIRWIQLAAGTAPDGIAGMLTRIAVNGQKDVYPKVLQSRFKFLAKIATDQENDPDAEFLPGWINRCCEFIR